MSVALGGFVQEAFMGGSWALKVNVSEFELGERCLTVTGDTHVGGVIFQLVEQLSHVRNDWSSFALWWPDKCQWLNKTKMTLDQYGVQGDAVLLFTRTHKLLRLRLPDQQVIDMSVDFSSCLFYALRQICQTIGIRHWEEASLLRDNNTSLVDSVCKKKPPQQQHSKAKNGENAALLRDHDSNSLSSSNTSTLNNSHMSHNSSSLKFRRSHSRNSIDNFNLDPQSLTLSPIVSVQHYLTKVCPKYKNIFDKTRINSRFVFVWQYYLELKLLKNLNL